MVRQLLLRSTLSLAFLAGLVQAESYQLDKSHSSINFKVSHMVISKTKGEFKDFTTEIEWDAKNLAKSSLNATIQVASINTNDEKRDEHLRNPDFFDVANHPTIAFKSEKIVKKGKGFEAQGSLTMRGVTKKVSIPFVVNGPVKSPWGATVLGFEGTLKVNRQDYGISFSKVLDNGGLAVGNEVEIEIIVEALQAAAK